MTRLLLHAAFASDCQQCRPSLKTTTTFFVSKFTVRVGRHDCGWSDDDDGLAEVNVSLSPSPENESEFCDTEIENPKTGGRTRGRRSMPEKRACFFGKSNWTILEINDQRRPDHDVGYDFCRIHTYTACNLFEDHETIGKRSGTSRGPRFSCWSQDILLREREGRRVPRILVTLLLLWSD